MDTTTPIEERTQGSPSSQSLPSPLISYSEVQPTTATVARTHTTTAAQAQPTTTTLASESLPEPRPSPAWYDIFGQMRQIKETRDHQKYTRFNNAFNFVTIMTADFFATVCFLLPWGLLLDGILTIYQKFFAPRPPELDQDQTDVQDQQHSPTSELMGALGLITTALRHVYAITGAGVGVILSFLLVPALYISRDSIKSYVDLDKDWVTVEGEPVDFWNVVFGRLARDGQQVLSEDRHLELVDTHLPLGKHYQDHKPVWLAAALLAFIFSYFGFVLGFPYMLVTLITGVLGFGSLAMAVGLVVAVLDVLQFTDRWIKKHIENVSASAPIAPTATTAAFDETHDEQPREPDYEKVVKFSKALRHTPEFYAQRLEAHLNAYRQEQNASSLFDKKLTRDVLFSLGATGTIPSVTDAPTTTDADHAGARRPE